MHLKAKEVKYIGKEDFDNLVRLYNKGLIEPSITSCPFSSAMYLSGRQFITSKPPPSPDINIFIILQIRGYKNYVQILLNNIHHQKYNRFDVFLQSF